MTCMYCRHYYRNNCQSTLYVGIFERWYNVRGYAFQNNAWFLFAITAAGVVPCGGPKKSPRTSSIVQVIFSFWSFEISEDILRNQKFIIG